MHHNSAWPKAMFKGDESRVVQEADFAQVKADGWFLTMEEAANPPVSDAPPTRDELEEKARDLGIKFDGRTSDKKLAAAIADAEAL